MDFLTKKGKIKMMKMTIERAALLKSLSHVQSVVERRQTIPILSNVLLETTPDNGGALRLRATDNEIEVSDMIPAKIEQAASLTVSAHKLYDIVKKLPEGSDVHIECDGDGAQLQVTSGRSRFALSTISAEGFPTMQVEQAASTFSLPSAALANLIERTQFAASTEETHYNLNGLYIHEKEGDKHLLKVAATDGHRLATAEIEAPEGLSGMPAVIVPRKTIGELTKLLAETDENVQVSVSQNQIRFSKKFHKEKVATSGHNKATTKSLMLSRHFSYNLSKSSGLLPYSPCIIPRG